MDDAIDEFDDDDCDSVSDTESSDDEEIKFDKEEQRGLTSVKTKLANDHYDNLSVVNVSDFCSDYIGDHESQMSDVLSARSKTSLPTSLSKLSDASSFKATSFSDFADLANMVVP